MKFFWDCFDSTYGSWFSPFNPRAQVELVTNQDQLRVLDRYTSAVVQSLCQKLQSRGRGTVEIQSSHSDPSLELLDGTIRGLDQIDHDGRPWLFKVPSEREDLSANNAQAREYFDVAAVLLIEDCEVEALYEYTAIFDYARSGISAASRSAVLVNGNVREVRIGVVIEHPEGPGDLPMVKLFEPMHVSAPKLTHRKVGHLITRAVTKATKQLVRRCIDDELMRVADALNSVVEDIPYPDFANARR
ncbi:hypothetical protein HPB50_020341 [Hyalomma asiaticum]|uniref:Uncharacterized protein n=1 Tax=Hyalomma asiaticum TaxID=266040 RepID=A0ACB7SN42_HYAAI|nr:hypothetical protein HPB50_020341 [Hyalomma asiaticum]